MFNIEYSKFDQYKWISSICIPLFYGVTIKICITSNYSMYKDSYEIFAYVNIKYMQYRTSKEMLYYYDYEKDKTFLMPYYYSDPLWRTIFLIHNHSKCIFME